MRLRTIDEIKDVVSKVYSRHSKEISEGIAEWAQDETYTLVNVAKWVYHIIKEECYIELETSDIKEYHDIPRGEVDAIIAEELIDSVNFEFCGFVSGF